MCSLRSSIGKTKRGASVEFTFDGATYHAPEGESLAAALLVAGVKTLRSSSMGGYPRGAFCFMGACQECLVNIDGTVIEACRVAVKKGIIVGRHPYADKEHK
ncbi:MAG: (2Fe-2S)-binding protein [Cohaesibacteraceae bacterium]|nr:(2Fe-2S)-binding protein [Cohaesibacteraceae bacterium]